MNKYIITGLIEPFEFHGDMFDNGEMESSVDPFMLQAYIFFKEITFDTIDCVGVIKIIQPKNATSCS